MNLNAIGTSPLVYRLGWTLLHSLWQGAVLAALLAIVLWCLSRASAMARYMVASCALLAMVASTLVTFLSISAPELQPAPLVSFSSVPSITGFAATQTAGPQIIPQINPSSFPDAPRSVSSTPPLSLTDKLQPVLPWLVVLWAAGVIALSLWRLGGWIALQRLRSLGTQPVAESLRMMLNRLAQRMKVSRPVRLAQSALVQTPVVIGWLWPIILMPASVLSGLAPAQLETILAHELAHIKRHDYLVNLVQTLVETLLFFHPAVWWISRQIRQEREVCCDDLAAQLCGDRILYAQTLVLIEELRPLAGPLVLAAGGGTMLHRIQRLLGMPRQHSSRQRGTLAAVCLALGLILIPLWLGHRPASAASPATNTTQASTSTAPAATQPTVAHTLSPPHGLVHDAKGAPIPNAQVILYNTRAAWGVGNSITETVSSDATGHFQFSKPLAFAQSHAYPYADYYVVFAKHPDYAIGWCIIKDDSLASDADICLTTPGTKSFHFVDLDNHPLAGVKIQLTSAGNDEDHDPLFRSMFYVGPDLVLTGAVSDKNGDAIVPNLPITNISFITAFPGYSSFNTGGFDKPDGNLQTLRLARLAKVSGIVRDPAGQAIPNAQVVFSEPAYGAKITASTDAQGRYTVDLVPKDGHPIPTNKDQLNNKNEGTGEYRASVLDADWTGKEVPLTVTAGQVVEGVNLTAERGVLIKGSVLEKDTERPIASAKVSGDSGARRFEAESDSQGHFTWRVPAGTLTAFFMSPPKGTFVEDSMPLGEGAPSAQLALDGTEGEVALVIHSPSRLGVMLTLKGKITAPPGVSVSNLRIFTLAAKGNPQVAAMTGYGGETSTEADGSFTLRDTPAGRLLDFMVETPDYAYALVTQITTADKGPEQDIGALALQPTQHVDVPIIDGQSSPLANAKIKMCPVLDGHEMWYHEREVATDAQGHLKVDGIIPGLQYQLRDGRNAISDVQWETAFHSIVTLIPKLGTTAPGPLMLSTELSIRVLDDAGKPVSIQDIEQFEVITEDGTHWTLGAKPEIKDRLADGWVLVDRQQAAWAHEKSKLNILFTTVQGIRVEAICPAFQTGDRLTFHVQITSVQLGVEPTGGPENVAKNELAGRVIDAAGNPIAGAVVSFPTNHPKIPERVKAVTTGPDGVFRFPAFPKNYMPMRIDRDGYARRWLVGPPVGQGFAVRLDNTTRIRSTVLLPDGKPAAGATITMDTSKPDLRYLDFGGSINNLEFTAQADAGGRFDVPADPGPYDLRVSAPGGLYALVQKIDLKFGQVLDQPIQLAPGVHLRVRAVDSVTGKPVPSATFYFWKQLPGVVMPEPGTGRKSDEQGIADWPSLMPGPQQLYVEADGYSRWGSPADTRVGQPWYQEFDIEPISLDLEPSMGEVLVRMERGMHLIGKVVDPDGQAVPNAYVNVKGLQTGDYRYARPTNNKGEFDLTVPGASRNGSILYRVVVYKDPRVIKPDGASEEFVPKIGGEKSFTIMLGSGNLTTSTEPATQP